MHNNKTLSIHAVNNRSFLYIDGILNCSALEQEIYVRDITAVILYFFGLSNCPVQRINTYIVVKDISPVHQDNTYPHGFLSSLQSLTYSLTLCFCGCGGCVCSHHYQRRSLAHQDNEDNAYPHGFLSSN